MQPRQLADYYYAIAGDYFIQSRDDVETLERVIDMANRAKNIYITMGGTDGSHGKLRSEDLINRALNRKSEIENACIRQGNELVKKSNDAYLMNYFTDAKIFALNASEVYSSCPYNPGVISTASLLVQIDARIEDIRVQAIASYDRAIQSYATSTPDGVRKCIELASISQKLYDSIGEEDGYASATALISKCSSGDSEYEQIRRKEADALLEEAKGFFIAQDCMNSTHRAGNSKGIYIQLYNEARHAERDLSPTRKVKTKLYDSLVKEVNALISKITDFCTRENMLKTAEEFYSRSQEFYLKNNMNEALAYANNAKTIYTQYQQFVGQSKADTLIRRINLRIAQRNEAKSHLAVARSHKMIAAFERAHAEANKALLIYKSILDRDNVEKVEDFIADIETGKKNLEKAQKHFSIAQERYELEDYEAALPEAKAAKGLFVVVNFTRGIVESESIIKESERIIEEERIKFRNTAIAVGAIALLVIILFVQFTGRKRQIESEYKRKLARDEEKVRRHEEEWSIRAEEETKSKVENELRKMVAEERGKIDED
jgi:hypothetical protein